MRIALTQFVWFSLRAKHRAAQISPVSVGPFDSNLIFASISCHITVSPRSRGRAMLAANWPCPPTCHFADGEDIVRVVLGQGRCCAPIRFRATRSRAQSRRAAGRDPFRGRNDRGYDLAGHDVSNLYGGRGYGGGYRRGNCEKLYQLLSAFSFEFGATGSVSRKLPFRFKRWRSQFAHRSGLRRSNPEVRDMSDIFVRSTDHRPCRQSRRSNACLLAYLATEPSVSPPRLEPSDFVETL